MESSNDRRRERLKRLGLCRECGECSPYPNVSICPACRSKRKAYQDVYNKQRKPKVEQMMAKVEVLFRLMRRV